MLTKLKQRVWELKGIVITAFSMTGLVIAGSFAGLFQLMEWSTLDQFFRWRSLESPDLNIVIVTIDEPSVSKLGHPINDATLAKVLTIIKQQQPSVIGLDLYRNLPVEPGHQQLVEVFESTPNLIGVEKEGNDSVDPPPVLEKLEQTSLSNLLLDNDGRVRRGLMTLRIHDDAELKSSLATRLALIYLENKGIVPETIDRTKKKYRWGKAVFVPLRKNSGAYIRADNSGYQILLNFRGSIDQFLNIPITKVVENNIPPNLFTDRIVLIGSTATSLKDFAPTPYDGNLEGTPGVVIHANITSQIVNAVLEERSLIRVWPDPLEWLWILGWSFIGASISWKLLESNSLKKTVFSSVGAIVLGIIVGDISLFVISFFVFLGGWWLPVISPLVALTSSGVNDRRL